MGCAASSPDPNFTPSQGKPGSKQAQEAAKDEAAAIIQGSAKNFLRNSQAESTKDAAAAEIQAGAADFLKRKRTSGVSLAAAPEEAPVLQKMGEAVSGAVDSVVQLSHRLFK